MKYYAVAKGHHTGIYTSWAAAQQELSGFSAPIFQRCFSYDEALDFIQAYEQSINAELKRLAQPFDANITTAGLQSPMHNYANVLYTAYCIKPVNDAFPEEVTTCQRFNLHNHTRNRSAAELYAVLAAVEKAISLGMKSIRVIYSFNGVKEFAERNWWANERINQNYQSKINQLSQRINIQFVESTDFDAKLAKDLNDYAASNQ